MRTRMSTDRPRLLAVVAHPDDETFGLGSLLRHATETGWDTTVLCATRGEAGDTTDATPPGELGAIREAETRAAAALLGVGSVEFLELHDSGMSGPAGPTTLVGAPLDAVVLPIRHRIETLRPSLVITLDASDGHRDHARIRDATLLAVDTASCIVDRVYLHCLPQVLMRRWVEHMIVNDSSWEHLRGNVPGTPEDLVTTVLDTAAHLDVRERAMALHASQRSPFDGLPAELRRDFLTSERLQRVRPVWTGGPVETALPPTPPLPTPPSSPSRGVPASLGITEPSTHQHTRRCWWDHRIARWTCRAHATGLVIDEGC